MRAGACGRQHRRAEPCETLRSTELVEGRWEPGPGRESGPGVGSGSDTQLMPNLGNPSVPVGARDGLEKGSGYPFALSPLLLPTDFHLTNMEQSALLRSVQNHQSARRRNKISGRKYVGKLDRLNRIL